MLKTSIRNNIISIIRDPTTILAILASIILCFTNGITFYTTGPNMQPIDTLLYLSEETAYSYAQSTMMTWVIIPIRDMLFSFISIVIAINLYKDIKTGLFDLINASQIKFRQYFISKILSYYIISVLLCTVLTVAYEIIYTIIQIPPDALFSWRTVLMTQAVAMVILYTSCIWIPIATAVFFSALTGIPAVGIIFNSVYKYIGLMSSTMDYTIWGYYIYTIPNTLSLYLRYWVLFPEGERLTLQKVAEVIPNQFYYI